MPGLSNPLWAQTGTELRALADAFATSHQRRELRCKAQETDLTHISWDRFRQLLEELFSVGDEYQNCSVCLKAKKFQPIVIKFGAF